MKQFQRLTRRANQRLIAVVAVDCIGPHRRPAAGFSLAQKARAKLFQFVEAVAACSQQLVYESERIDGGVLTGVPPRARRRVPRRMRKFENIETVLDASGDSGV